MTQYRRGRDLEYAVRDHLQAEGYETFRSAGSRSPIDVIGFKPRHTVFVQCKLDGRCPPSERAELLRVAALAGAVPIVAARPPRKPIEYRRLVGSGPRDFEPWTPDLIAKPTPESAA
ncbi:hypothetical protein [Nocardia sp. NPDC049707]|uniref:hypothetical protein n=1 Tax=Nocardia sp. NPDC049707 TaxID=3154735 RepID=UPI003440B618